MFLEPHFFPILSISPNDIPKEKSVKDGGELFCGPKKRWPFLHCINEIYTVFRAEIQILVLILKQVFWLQIITYK